MARATASSWRTCANTRPSRRVGRGRRQGRRGDETSTVVGNARARGTALHRYRCAACGFEAEHYFWQCPGCLGWDTYPPQRLEDL